MKRVLKILGGAFLLTLIAPAFPGHWTGVGQFFSHLLLGGFRHAWHAVPQALASGPGPIAMAGWLVAATVALHLFLRSFYRSTPSGPRPWRGAWSLSTMTLLLVLFAATCASVGLTHHVAWLFRGQLMYDVSRGVHTKSISNARQICTALAVYASLHYGVYPARLEDMAAAEMMEAESLERLKFTHLPDSVPVHWLYLPGLHQDDPGNLPVLVSPFPFPNGQYVVGYRDLSVALVSAETWRSALQRWREHRASTTTTPSPP
jgi:hypothetical protein